MKTVTPHELKTLLLSDIECALIDVREQEEFSRCHPLLASCLPLSRLELDAERLVPCKKTVVVLLDSGPDTELDSGWLSLPQTSGEGIPSGNEAMTQTGKSGSLGNGQELVSAPRSRLGAARLEAAGYSEVYVLEGGLKAWKEAGMQTFTGVGALSKAFGELVEEELDTPRLEPEEVKALLDGGANVKVIDVRPWEEYHNMNIPGSTNLPGCEVLYRIADAVPDPETQIVINCAGRTRSIIGTQTLRNAGVPNPVAALKGGTMNWTLSGLALEYGASRTSAPPSFRALQTARERAMKVAEDYGVEFISPFTLRQWQAEAAERTLYVFDVRQPEEYAAGHITGSLNAPGGQLVQATDEYAAVRNARFVLVDDTEARAVMTAHWLKQMGLPQVFVLRGGLGHLPLMKSAAEAAPESAFIPPQVLEVSPLDLQAMLSESDPPLVINVGQSKRHQNGHIPDAVWVIRAYMNNVAECHPGPRRLVLTCDDGRLAPFAAADARTLWPEADIKVLAGGNEAWARTGLPLESGLSTEFCPADDVWYKPYEDTKANKESMQEYFSWEARLVADTKADGCVNFRLGPIK